MRADHLPDDRLTAADVPPPDAPLEELLRFGHRYHAYKVAGSLPRVAEVALALHDEWAGVHGHARDAVLDAPLPQLRVALFHTVRAVAHEPDGTSTDVGPDAAAWVRVLVGSVRAAVDDRAAVSLRPRGG